MLYFYTAYTHSMEGILCVLEYYFLTIIFIIILVSSLFVIIFLFGNLFSFFNQIFIYVSFFFLHLYILFHFFFFSDWFFYLKKYIDFEHFHLVSLKKKIEKNSNITITLRKLSKFRRYMLRRYGLIPREHIYFFFFSYSSLIPFFVRKYRLIIFIYSSFLRYIGLFLPIFFSNHSNKKNLLTLFGINIQVKKESFFFLNINFKLKKKIRAYTASKKSHTNFLKNFLITLFKATNLEKKNTKIFYTKLLWALDFNFFRFLHFHNKTSYWKSLISIFFTTYIYYILPQTCFFFFSQKLLLTQLSFSFLNLENIVRSSSVNLSKYSIIEYVSTKFIKQIKKII